MPARSVPLTQIPGTSRLMAGVAYDFSRVSRFYHLSPWESESYAAAADAVEYPAERRAALVEALGEQNPGHPSLDLLGRPKTVVVATGQQVGLFGGPAYTIYKALTAARLARSLSERGIRAVPVFWMATEDHDLAEVSHVRVFDANSQPVRIEATGRGGPQQPVGGIPVGDGCVKELDRALGGLPFAADVLALAGEAYAPGRTFGEAFRDLLRGLVGPYGLLFLDPLRPAVRRLAAPILTRARDEMPGLVRLVVSRSRELEEAGYHAQVLVEESGSLLFALAAGRRIKHGATPDGVTGEDLSPNALLRPVVQDYMMPTVAVVMGPAEVAYMAQAEVLYRALLGRMPVVVPRACFTLADARSAKLMERYELKLADLEQGEEAVRERIARRLVPPALEKRLLETAARTLEGLRGLRPELASFDPTLAEAMDLSERKILYQFGKLERKVGREALRRDRRAAEETDHLSRLLYPHRQLQERFYSILPFLARHGMSLLETIYANIRLDTPDHQVLPV